MGFEMGLVLAFVLATTDAEVITSTFGPSDSFITFGGAQVGGKESTGRADELAVAFTPAFDAMLDQIRVAVFSTSLTSGDRDLLVELSQGPAPNKVLEAFATTVIDGAARIYTFNSILHPSLFAGQTYWIVLASNDLVDNLFGWNTNSAGFYSALAEKTPLDLKWQLFFNASPAFEVSGQLVPSQPVPEPRMTLVIGWALVLAGLRRRRPTDCLKAK